MLASSEFGIITRAQTGEGGEVAGVVHRPAGDVVEGDIRLADGDKVWPQSSNSQLACTGQQLGLYQ